MRLRHRRLGAVQHVGDEAAPERQIDVRAVDVARLLLIDEEQMVAAGPAGDIDVFAQLDVAVGAEDGQTSVAPGRQPVGREPVDTDVAGAAVPGQHHVTEVLELRTVLVRDVADLRGDDLGARRSGVEEELIDLMRPDVGQDPAVARRVPEPLRPGGRGDAMRCEIHRLDDASDRAGLHELAGLDRGAHLVPLAVEDRVDPFGLGLDPPHLRELFQRRHAGLVGHDSYAGGNFRF